MLSKFYNCACSLFFAILIISIALVSALTTASSTAKKEGSSSFPSITLPPLSFGLGSLRPHLTHEQINLHYNAHQSGYVTFLKNWFESATGETAEAISKLHKSYLDDVRAAEIQFVQNAGANQLGDVTKEVPPGMRLNKMNQSFVTFLSSASRGSSLPVGSKHRNFASQVFNHGLYFSSLTDEPILLGDYLSAFQTTSPLANAVKEQFGSAEKFEEEFEKITTAHFASGWVWLGALRKMVNGRRVTKLFIIDSHDAETFYDRISGRGKVPVFSLATNGVEQYEFDLDAGDEVEPILVCDVWEHAYYPDYRNKRGDYVKAWFKVVDWKRVDERLQTNPLNVEVRPFRLDDKERGKRLFGKRSTDEREAAGEMTDAYPFFV